MESTTRRTFLGGTALALGVALAGCTGGGDGDDETEDDGDATDGGGDDTATGSGDTSGDGESGTDGETDGETGGGTDDGAAMGDEYPAVEEWLTETTVGGADDSYDGSIDDRRDADTVTVDVGAEGNGGAFAFGPSAIGVSTGTTVEWRWTGEGNPHNVVADPDEQIGESDFEFSSGDAVGGSGVQYTQTFDEAGVALYHCEPHLSLGMKGAVVVVD